MPTIRVGFSSDFVVNNNRVGLGTVSAAGSKLDVDGAIRGNFNVTGVATLTSYGGFIAQRQYINKSSTIGFATVGLNTAGAAIGVGATQVANQYYETETGFTDLGGVHHGDDQFYNTLSEDLVIDDGQILNITNIDMVGVTTIGEYDPHTHASHVIVGSLEQVSVTDHFSVPNGGINERRSFIEGTVRFNTDLNTLEFFNGNEWRQFTYNQGQSGRGVFMGGREYPAPNTPGAAIANISYIQISTRGNVQDFGSLENGGPRESGACLGSSTRSIKGGGTDESAGEEQNDIQYITTASQGNAIDFGDLNNRVRSFGAVSSSTRGLFAGGCVHPNTDTDSIDYIEMSTLGDAIDFGDHVAGRNIQGIGSPTKAVFGGGNGSTTLRSVNIASKGNTTFFGDAFQVTSGSGTVGNSVRGIFCGGYNISPTGSSVINYITFASNGNGTDFGEMNGLHQTASSGGMSSATKGVFGPGQSPFTGTNNIAHYLDEITISTSGSATDFGDSGPHGNFNPKVSDSHGGLGGF